MQQLFFTLITVAAFYVAGKQFLRIRRNILLGKDASITGDIGQRWRNVVLIAFGQKKMFKNVLVAVLHAFIYVAFVVTQVELLEVFVDGFFGTHRFFAPYLGGLYTFAISSIEVLSALAFVATLAFLSRRNILKIARFQKPELTGWPSRDANLILLGEIILITAIFTMNGADRVLQDMGSEHYHHTSGFAISSWLGPMLFGNWSETALIAAERFGWWLHTFTVFGFMVYLPFSKHLHIFLAFPNTYYSKLTPKGEMENMPLVMNEVRSMMGLPTDGPGMSDQAEMPVIGANDVTSLTWKNLLDAYSCTECGRCTAACPANLTGKKLSPRKVMMDVRDRADEVGYKMDTGEQQYICAELRESGAALTAANFDDGRSLFDLISPEEIHACTTCNACVEACPVSINPLDIILSMRRHEILTQSAGPTDWLPMFNALENTGAVWQMPVDRENWTR